MRVVVHKADEPNLEPGEIDIRALIGEANTESLPKIMDHDAELIVDVLFATLPQGTLERVLGLLITRRASTIVLAHRPKL